MRRSRQLVLGLTFLYFVTVCIVLNFAAHSGKQLANWDFGASIRMPRIFRTNATVNAKEKRTKKSNDAKKIAYVFYATSENYFCHAMVNIDLMVNQLNVTEEADFVIIVLRKIKENVERNFCIQKCYGSRVKLIEMDPPVPEHYAKDQYFKNCYMKLLSFSLYALYSRIIYLDSDGVVMKNLDHLFDLNLAPFSVAAADSHWLTTPTRTWLTSILFVADLSPELNRTVLSMLEKDNFDKILHWPIAQKGSHYDMEIFNYVFEQGKKVKLLPFDYARIDKYFVIDSNAKDIETAFYVHFSQEKPFYFPKTRRYRKDPSQSPSKSDAYLRPLAIFWRTAEKLCPI